MSNQFPTNTFYSKINFEYVNSMHFNECITTSNTEKTRDCETIEAYFAQGARVGGIIPAPPFPGGVP